MTQAQRILAHLQTGQPLTPLQALSDFGCFRLAARIDELRQDGHAIDTIIEKGKRHATYRMH
jgi:biotin operon repressor